MNTQEITLDVSKAAGVTQVVRLGQGDSSGTTLAATIYDNGTALDTTGLAAHFVMLLPGGESYYRETATLSGNVATVTIDESYAAAVVGKTDVAYFELTDNDEVVCSTNRFTVLVLRSAIDGAEIAEEWDNAITDAITRGNSAANAATEAANTATTAANSATSAAEDATEAATDALAAAEEARGAVPSELSLYLDWVEDDDGDQILAVVDVTEA